MPPVDTRIVAGDWPRLIGLAILWGGSYFFVSIALRELPPFTIVFVRMLIAALVLAPLLWIYRIDVPRTLSGWVPFIGMGLLNNVIPFSLIVSGQTYISGGMASVINAMTPLMGVVVFALAGAEPLIARRLIGVVIGVVGVATLRGVDVEFDSAQTVGIVLCLGASLSFSFSTLWAKHRLTGVPPIQASTFQLMASAVMMFVLCAIIEQPWHYPMPGTMTWLALLALGGPSTALGYILFFQIIRGSGPSNVMLVTLLVPVTAILLGYLILEESVSAREIVGALLIASALLIMDGRIFGLFRRPVTT
ncbi:MAG TPA: DMT family transporter [Xanthobacteraceae bacterium]|nr:DMT family transporter [Xanthobacteraceae bacterium]